MLNDAGLAIAIDDARARHAAVLNLVMATDQQAVTLLSVYLTTGTAAAAASVSAFTGSFIPPVVGWALLAATFSLFAGSIFCFRAMRGAMVSAPGKAPEFWLWALENDGVDIKYAAHQYLLQLAPQQDHNRLLNQETAFAHWQAKLLGIVSPLAALVGGGAAWVAGA